jgi:hypothetical protein
MTPDAIIFEFAIRMVIGIAYLIASAMLFSYIIGKLTH